MPYPFLGSTGRSYVQYIDEATGRILQAQPGGTYAMQPVPGAGDVSVPPGDGLWGAPTSDGGEAGDETPAAQAPANDASAPPGAPDQPARMTGLAMKPAADAAQEG